MKALQYHAYGGPEVLAVDDAPEPHAGPGQVRDPGRGRERQPARLEDPRRV